MVIAALATGWWLDHRRLMALLPSSNPSEYLVELNLSRDDQISMLNRKIIELETIVQPSFCKYDLDFGSG